MAITPLPDAPLTTDTPQQFNAKAFAWVQALGTFVTEANAQADSVDSQVLIAEDWASKTDGNVESTDYSSKAWAIGGTGVTDTATRGASKEWAIETSSTVDGTEYSSKEYAVGTQIRGSSGSAKDWAQYTGGTVDGTNYSAKYWATEAASSAGNAEASELQAGIYAGNAEDALTAALAAQSAAESARDTTLAAYDQFDDRYLGTKSSDPSVDNDGNPLVAGALYFNDVDEIMKLYTGSAWVAAYVSGGGFLLSSNNLSDVTNVTTAQQNLDLEPGVDIQVYDADTAKLDVVQTWSAEQTFNGGLVLGNRIKEKVTVSATAATGTINFDAITQGVLYYTTDASGDWTLNVRGDGSTSLDSVMSTGQSITIAFLPTIGSTTYYQTAFTIDGSSVTPKWQGASAPSAGNASGIDAYVFTIVKTASATFTVLGSLTQFA